MKTALGCRKAVKLHIAETCRLLSSQLAVLWEPINRASFPKWGEQKTTYEEISLEFRAFVLCSPENCLHRDISRLGNSDGLPLLFNCRQYFLPRVAYNIYRVIFIVNRYYKKLLNIHQPTQSIKKRYTIKLYHKLLQL